MASDKQFVEFVTENIANAGEITVKPMFGEFGIYSDGKLFGLVCDNRLLIKRTAGGREFLKDPTEAAPYPGAKPCFLIDDFEDREKLSELIRITVKELPAPKPKKPKK